MPLILLPALAALAPGAAATAPPSPASAQRDRCAFEAWAIDEDPHGLNVRAGPSARARIVGTLPAPALDPEIGMTVHAGVKIVESRHGWFRISSSGWHRNLENDPNDIEGWIYGRFVGFDLQTDKAFAEPDPHSRVVATAWRDKDGGHPFEFRNPSECSGEWVRLLVKGHDGRERLGWVRGTCAIEETTCDGVAGDLMKYEDMPEY